MNDNKDGLRIIFAGTPVFAQHHLQALIDSPHHIVGVYTQPDRPAGRGKKLTPSPVKQLALENNLPVFQPQSLKDSAAQQELAALNADIMIVVAYGLILPKAVLDTPPKGCLNVHGSILPRWRGAAPIQRALAAGDAITGVTIMQMDVGLDTGDMLLIKECPITDDDTSASLHDKLMGLGAEALLETLELVQNDALHPVAQNNDEANYAEKISKEEASIDWSQSAAAISRAIRAYNPFPVAYSFLDGERLKFYQAELTDITSKAEPGTIIGLDAKGLQVTCGDSILLVKQMQVPGKKPMLAADLANGYSDLLKSGRRLGQ